MCILLIYCCGEGLGVQYIVGDGVGNGNVAGDDPGDGSGDSLGDGIGERGVIYSTFDGQTSRISWRIGIGPAKQMSLHVDK